MMKLLMMMLAVAISIGQTGTAEIWDVAIDGGVSTKVATVETVETVETPPPTPVEAVCLTLTLDWSPDVISVVTGETWTMDGAVVNFTDIPIGRQFRWGLVGTFLQLNMDGASAVGKGSAEQTLTSVEVAGETEVKVCQ